MRHGRAVFATTIGSESRQRLAYVAINCTVNVEPQLLSVHASELSADSYAQVCAAIGVAP
jgi:hypothetical protein